MDFIQTANKQVDKFGVGKHGFSAGNPGGGVLATLLSNLWCDGVQQELISVIEAAGLVATGATLTQVRQAIKRMCGGNVRTITAAGPTVLTADDAGLVILDATANAVAVTLPAVNAVTGVPLLFEFVRVDTTGNAVTITRAGADTFVGGATSFSLTGQGDQRTIAGNATSTWATTATMNSPFNGGNQSLGASGYQKLPGGLIVQWGVADGSGTNTGTTTFPITFPSALYQVVLGASTANASTSQLTGTSTANFSWNRNSVNTAVMPFVAFGK